MALADLRPKPFTSEYQPANRGRKKGVPNRATVYKEILNLKTKVKTPEGETKSVTLYEAAALGQVKSAMKGNTPAWKEVQDTLHGKMADRLEIEVEVINRIDTMFQRLLEELSKLESDPKRLLMAFTAYAVGVQGFYDAPAEQADRLLESYQARIRAGDVELVENEDGEFEVESSDNPSL